MATVLPQPPEAGVTAAYLFKLPWLQLLLTVSLSRRASFMVRGVCGCMCVYVCYFYGASQTKTMPSCSPVVNVLYQQSTP